MGAQTVSGAEPPPRILEVGPLCLFKWVWPGTTTWLLPDSAPIAAARAEGAPAWLPFGELPSVRSRLRDRAFDLIVCLPPGLPGFVLRSRVRTLWWRLTRGRRPAPGVFAAVLSEAGATPVAVLDMDDGEPIAPANFPLFAACRAYFKRELPEAPARLFAPPAFLRPSGLLVEPLSWLAKLRTISLGLSRRRLAAAPRTPPSKSADVFFSGRVNSRARAAGVSALRSLAARGVAVDVAEGLTLEEYLQRCAAAWLVWSPEGEGRDCFRHYEAGLCRSVPLINRSPVTRHRPLLDGTHCFQYDAAGTSLEEVVRRALGDKARLTRMAEAAHAHVLAHHTHEALCRYVLAEVFGR